MRRATLAIFAAVMGTAVLVGLKAPFGVARPASVVATGPVDPGLPAPSPSADADPTHAVRPSTSPSPPVWSSASTRPTKPGPAPSTAKPSAVAKTVDGSREQASHYGYVRVRITVTGSRMTDITMLEVTSEPNSAARRAPATLIQEALAAQNADIANVSEATYTSEAFEASLRTALGRV